MIYYYNKTAEMH